MCVISVCPKGTVKNSKQVIEFIKKGCENNKEGSGFMFKRNGEHKITISKGYFDYNRLSNDILLLNLQVDDELVIHHRRSTHGKVSPENCHPYIITNNVEDSRQTKIITRKACLTHNGVFKNIEGYISRNKDLSDTYAFTRYFMTNRHIMSLFKSDKELFRHALAGILYNAKLAILFPDRNVEMFGDFIEDDGYFHSNDGYCRVNEDRGGFTNYSTGYKNYNQRYDNFWEDNDPVDSSVFPDELPGIVTKSHKKLDDVLLLDSTKIVITKDNCKDFYIIEKVNYWSVHRNNSYFTLGKLDEDAEFQLLNDPEDDHAYYTISTMRLFNSCFYIPKNKDIESIYTDYLDLTRKNDDIGVKTIKNLIKMIEKSKSKDGNDLIFYGKYNNSYRKKALLLYKNYLLSITPDLYQKFVVEKEINANVN